MTNKEKAGSSYNSGKVKVQKFGLVSSTTTQGSKKTETR